MEPGLPIVRISVDSARPCLFYMRVLTNQCVDCWENKASVYEGHVHPAPGINLGDKILAGRCVDCYNKGPRMKGRDECPGCCGELPDGKGVTIELQGVDYFTVRRLEVI